MTGTPFKDNVVIVTGASSGIGAEVSRQMAAQGARLALAARDASRLEQVAAECRAAGGDALTVPTDVTDREQCRTLVERCVAYFGRLDTLVNNAGISMWSRLDRLADLDVIERLVQVNLMGSIAVTYYALPHLKASRGRIVAVSSIAGRAAAPGVSGYSASKFGMVGFFDSLRIELADDGVSVTMVYPGFVESEIRQRALGSDGSPLGARARPIAGQMSAADCARHIVDAAARRQRQRVMTFEGRFSPLLRIVAPRLIDRLSARTIRRGK